MTHKVDKKTDTLSLIEDISEKQDNIELAQTVDERMNDGHRPIRVTLDDL